MKKVLLYTMFSFASFSLFAQNQPQIPNGGFENWITSNNVEHPTNYFNHKHSGGIAATGTNTLTKVTTGAHSGNYSISIKTVNVPVVNVKLNGNLCSGYVNAPGTNILNVDKSEGYIGTLKHGGTASDRRVLAFDGRPDSLVGYFKYTSGGAGESARISAILHVGDYNDPEIPVNNNHADLSANKIGKASFTSAVQNYTEWTRFSVPFVYTSQDTPEYIMINITSSSDQMTEVEGSILYLDDLEVIYNPQTPSGCAAPTNLSLTNNGTSLAASWVAPTPAPALGYFYAVTPQGNTATQADYATSVPTSVSNITATTGVNSTPLVNGETYTVTVMAVCAHAAGGYSTTVSEDVIFGTASVNDLKVNKVNVYNSNGKLFVDLTLVNSTDVTLSVTDLSGKLIIEKALNSAAKNEIDVNGNGIYLYSIKANDFTKNGKLQF